MVTTDPRCSEDGALTSTAFIQFVDGSFRPRASAYFCARPGASPADLASAGLVLPGGAGASTAVLIDRLAAWPAHGYGTSVTELGPRPRRGGRLVAVTGVTASPPTFLTWLRASPLGRGVARAFVFPDGGATVRARTVDELMCALTPPPPGAAVRVMAYPRVALETALLENLPLAAWPVLTPSGATHVLIAVDTRAVSSSDEVRCDDDGGGCDVGVGRSPPPPPLWAALVPPGSTLADTTPERRRPADSPSKAAAKLSEAMAVALPPPPPPGTRPAIAIDVGAAPGGWTQLLARSGRFVRVVAVEPGDLDAAISALPGVVHVRALAENAGPAVRTAMVEVAGGEGVADLLACDANVQLPALAGLVGEMARLLRRGAPAIITLKTSTRSRLKDGAAAQAALALARVQLRVVWVLFLAANTQCERTLVCVKV